MSRGFFLMLLGCTPFVLASEPVGEVLGGADSTASAERVIYDQRQSGKYNINLSIKDFALIQIDQNDLAEEQYDYEDYYYDEDHLTVKPIQLMPLTPANPSTTTPTTTTSFTQQKPHSPSSTIVSIPTPTKHLTTTTLPPTTQSTLPDTERPTITYSPNLLADLVATQRANENPNPISTSSSTTTTTTPSTTTPRPLTQTPTTAATTKKTHSVVILQTTPTFATSSTSQASTIGPLNEVNARSKEIPIRSIEQPPPRPFGMGLIHPRHRYSALQQESTAGPSKQPKDDTVSEDDSKIYKFKMRRTHKFAPKDRKDDDEEPLSSQAGPQTIDPSARHRLKGHVRRCRGANQQRDEHGICRGANKRSSPSSSTILKKLFTMLVALPFAAARDPSDSQ